MNPEVPAIPPADRLESWKEIAAYLNRDVSTAQRWERQEGLPVHRLPHAKQGSVFAFRSELDAWRERRAGAAARSLAVTDRVQPVSPQPSVPLSAVTGIDDLPAIDQDSHVASWRRFSMPAVAAVIACLGVAAAFVLTRPRLEAVPFQPRGWLIVAAFDNRTGDPLLEGSLETALEHELSRSTYANVVPRARVEDALRLMQRPADTPLDEATAREIALRDGAIAVVVSGTIERIAGTLVVQTRIVRPVDGQRLAVIRREAHTDNEVLPAIGLVAEDIRRHVGEVMPPEPGGAQLEKVTTPSLHALHLYSQAVALGNVGKWDAAEPLLREALEKDPQFAAAHNWLGWSLKNQEPERQQAALVEFKKAADLAAQTSDPERYFFLGTYFGNASEPEKALAAYKALLAVQPDHFWGAQNAGYTLDVQLHRPREAVEYYQRASDLRPHNCSYALFTAIRSEEDVMDLDAAARYLDRARAIAAASPHPAGTDIWAGCDTTPRRRTFARTFEVMTAMIHGENATASRLVDKLARSITMLHDEERRTLGVRLADLYMELGRLRDAERMAVNGNPAQLHTYQALIALEREDRRAACAAMREYASVKATVIGGAIEQLASCGLVDEAEAQLQRGLKTRAADEDPVLVLLARGQIDAARGRTALAGEELQRGLNEWRGSAAGPFFPAVRTLARLHVMNHEPARAIHLLEETCSAHRVEAFIDGSGDYWLLMQAELAALYRQAGRKDEAETIEAELTRRLAYADKDHAIVRALGIRTTP